SPGQPPTPNAVTVSLDDAGRFDVFNRFGQVNLVIDVVGYFGEHQHDGHDIVDSSLTRVDIADEPGLASAAAVEPQFGWPPGRCGLRRRACTRKRSHDRV